MAKYDEQIQDLPSQLASAKSILICLSPQITTDELASALSLALALQKSGKQATVVTDASPTVAHSNLFGVGEVKNVLPSSGAGNFMITLENVVDPSGQMQTVPSLEKLDWYPEGANLNLVFHVIPGQRFEPTKVNYKHENQGFDLIFVLGAGSLTELGSIYSSNPSVFENNPVVNIDIASTNTNFGKYNLVDPNASSLSEVVTHLVGSLSLTLDNDIATNLIAGIYEATGNMTQRVSADTFQAASQMIQAGARMPQASQQSVVSSQQTEQAQPQTIVSVEPAQAQPVVQQPVQPEPSQPSVDPQAPASPTAPSAVDSSYLTNSPWLTQEPQIQFSPSSTPSFDSQPVVQQPQIVSQPYPVPQPVETQPNVVPQAQPVIAPSLSDIQNQPNPGGFDLRQVFQIPQMPSQAQTVAQADNQITQQSIVDSQQTTPVQQQTFAPNPSTNSGQAATPQVASREERPAGEVTTSTSPELEGTPAPDWLVPKIFKGGNLG